MKSLDSRYAPVHWWPWAAQGRGIVGESEVKARVHEIRLRRISRAVFWRALRLGWGKGADLRWAKLKGANLQKANLWGANLANALTDGAIGLEAE